MILSVAICTERVEAKHRYYFVTDIVFVAICTERVEAKIVAYRDIIKKTVALQSARSVWRQSL